jgi:ubiquinone/menaquinone biosynthesis C-methylase UbiE
MAYPRSSTPRPRARHAPVRRGTGPGTAARLACDLDAIVTAVDAESGMVDLARERAPRARIHHAVLPDLPLRARELPTPFVANRVNHVGDPMATIRELHRILPTRQEGRVTICSPRRTLARGNAPE